ncbi:hypothetical protein CHU98_g12341 [Xylaria longipes]|nr:hypothetical protein CHU98_g12341 [Xylaria longipes]
MRQLLLGDLDTALRKTVGRFKPDTSDALNQLKSPQSIFSASGIQAGESVRGWAGGIFRPARAARRLSDGLHCSPANARGQDQQRAYYENEAYIVTDDDELEAEEAQLVDEG